MRVWQHHWTSRLVQALVAAALAAVTLTTNALAAPLATIEGVEDPDLRETLYRIIGEATGPAESRWRARERARRAADRIRLYLNSQGYYGALVDARLGDDQSALVRVRPNARFTFAGISLNFENGDSTGVHPDPDLADNLLIAEGAPVIAQDILDSEAMILQSLRNSGWVEAQAGEREIIVDHATGQASASFNFETGPYITFGPPQLAGGLADLREGYIARLAPFEVGQAASLDLLEQYTQRLQALDSVALADTRLSPDDTGRQRRVDVRMEPSARHTIALSGRYSTTEGAGADAQWTRRNMFRGDETLTLTTLIAQLGANLHSKLELPHWNRYGQTLHVEAGLSADRTDAFDQDAIMFGLGLSRPLVARIRAATGVKLQLANITDADGERNLNSISLPTELVYDGRADVLDPDHGIYGALQLAPGLSWGDASTQYVRAVAELRHYQPLAGQLTLATRLRAGALLGANAENVPADQRFYAGGGGSVRGYDYQGLSPERIGVRSGQAEPFGGASLIEASAELRWRRSERLGFAGFLDAGVAGAELNPDLGELRYGAGFGVRYYPGFGPIRLDIATPLDARDGESPIALYISIGQAF